MSIQDIETNPYGPLVGFQVGSTRGANAILVVETSGRIQASREYRSGGWTFEGLLEEKPSSDCPCTYIYFDKDKEVSRERVVPTESPAALEADEDHTARLKAIDEYYQFEVALQQELMEQEFHGDPVNPRVKKEVDRVSMENELRVAREAVSQEAATPSVA